MIDKAKVGHWLTEGMWELYERRKNSTVPVMRRQAIVAKTKALIVCDRILSNRSIYETY